jgi:hypothetical protein
MKKSICILAVVALVSCAVSRIQRRGKDIFHPQVMRAISSSDTLHALFGSSDTMRNYGYIEFFYNKRIPVLDTSLPFTNVTFVYDVRADRMTAMRANYSVADYEAVNIFLSRRIRQHKRLHNTPQNRHWAFNDDFINARNVADTSATAFLVLSW